MQNDALGLLHQKMQEDVNAITDALTSGGAGDYAAYTLMCGKIHGLQLAQRTVADMQHRLRAADGDED